MKNLFLLISLLVCGTYASAQSTGPDSSNWAHVQAIAAGTSVHVSARHGGGTCSVKSADAESLICAAGGGNDKRFSRVDVKSIKLARRGRSVLLGALIGAGAGAGVGAAFDASQSGTFIGGRKAESAGIGAVIGAVIIAPIGYFTDFARGPTVYRAP